LKFSASRREKKKQLIEKDELPLMQKDLQLSQQDGKHMEDKDVTQVLEWAKLIHKLNDKCAAIQKEKQRMNKMSRAQYVAPGLRGNSPSELIASWMRAFLSVSFYPSLLRY
jgi:hypothetical protein